MALGSNILIFESKKGIESLIIAVYQKMTQSSQWEKVKGANDVSCDPLHSGNG